MAARQPPSSASAPAGGVSMKEYLKRYQSGAANEKKTKNKPKPAAAAGGVLIVDEDPVWQKPVQIEEDDPASSGDDRPLVDEDVEVKRMRRLEAIRAARPYNAIAEDGSGWVTVSATESGGPTRRRNDTPSPEPGGEPREDLLPPQRRQRRDAPSRQDTPSPKRNGVAEQGDLSPPRKSRRQVDPSPPWRRARHDSEEPHDLSPPRRRVRHDSEEPHDLSPPRQRTRHDSEEPKDLSPPRRRAQNDSEKPKDLSPQEHGTTWRSRKISLHLGVGHGMTRRSRKTSLHLSVGRGMTRRSPKTSHHLEGGKTRTLQTWVICHFQEGKIWGMVQRMETFHQQGRAGNLHQMIYLHCVRRETFLPQGRGAGRKKLQRR